eukprot:gene25261-10910_t
MFLSCQAIQASFGVEQGAPSQRAQSAVLPDRWTYYVRTAALEEVMQGAMGKAGGVCVDTIDLNKQPPDVRAAVVSLQDVGETLVATLLDMLDVLRSLQKRETENEEQSTPVSGLGDILSFPTLERLSYAPLAVSSLGDFAGVPEEEILAVRVKAMESCDLGMRLESAISLANKISSRLAARAALSGMSG